MITIKSITLPPTHLSEHDIKLLAEEIQAAIDKRLDTLGIAALTEVRVERILRKIEYKVR